MRASPISLPVPLEEPLSSFLEVARPVFIGLLCLLRCELGGPLSLPFCAINSPFVSPLSSSLTPTHTPIYRNRSKYRFGKSLVEIYQPRGARRVRAVSPAHSLIGAIQFVSRYAITLFILLYIFFFLYIYIIYISQFVRILKIILLIFLNIL
jgi:hypothetical protein